MRGGTKRVLATAAYLFGLHPAVAVSELGIHRGLMKLESSLHAGPMTTQDGKTGKPTVDSGEHLDPYDVPAELIGDVGMAGAKGAQGAQGECGDPGVGLHWPELRRSESAEALGAGTADRCRVPGFAGS